MNDGGQDGYASLRQGREDSLSPVPVSVRAQGQCLASSRHRAAEWLPRQQGLEQCAQPSRFRIVKEMFFVSKHVVHLRTRGADLQAGGHEVYVNQTHSRFNEERKLGTLG